MFVASKKEGNCGADLISRHPLPSLRTKHQSAGPTQQSPYIDVTHWGNTVAQKPPTRSCSKWNQDQIKKGAKFWSLH